MAFTITVSHAGSPITARVGSVITAQYGRQDSTSTISPASVSFTVVYDSAGLGVLDPNDFEVGNRIILTVQNAALASAQYFSGTITDVAARHHELAVIAVSDTLSSINRTPIDLAGYTGSLTGTVVNAALLAVQAEGGLPAKTITTSTGTNTVTTAAQTNVQATSFLGPVIASEPSGVLCEVIGGARFSDYNDRRVATMPATQKFDLSTFGTLIGYDWQLEKTVADFVNLSTVTWTGGIATFSDATSVASFGTYARSVSTVVNNATQADYMALRTVQHGLAPGWRTSGIMLDMARLSDANRDLITKNMRTGSYVKLPLLITGAQTEYFVEGWSDQFIYGATGSKQWWRTLYVSDITISQAAQRYLDVTSGVTYATVNGSLRWIDLEQQQI